jgi:MarR family transcriptional regulator, lower aerobic nicotinate degradation pathway regulator
VTPTGSGTEGKTAVPVQVDLGSAPGHLLRRAQRVHTETWLKLVSVPVTGPQYAVLVAVAGWPDVDQRLVGELAAHDKATVAEIVARLDRDGWLDRVRDERDGRRRILTLTEFASKAMPQLTAEAAAVQVSLLDPLREEDRPEFITLLARIAIRGPAKIAGQSPGDTLLMARTPGYLLRRAQQVHGGLWSRHVSALTGPQYAMLSSVAAAGALDQAGLGQAASLDSSTVTEMVRRLEGRGWLLRSTDGADRRRRQVQLSSSGRTVLAEVRDGVFDVQARVLEPLSQPEAARFLVMLQAVARWERPGE